MTLFKLWTNQVHGSTSVMIAVISEPLSQINEIFGLLLTKSTYLAPETTDAAGVAISVYDSSPF